MDKKLLLETIFMTLIENLAGVTNDIQGPWEYPHHRENLYGHTSIHNIAMKLLWCFTY